jgi:hypothetical protein
MRSSKKWADQWKNVSGFIELRRPNFNQSLDPKEYVIVLKECIKFLEKNKEEWGRALIESYVKHLSADLSVGEWPVLAINVPFFFEVPSNILEAPNSESQFEKKGEVRMTAKKKVKKKVVKKVVKKPVKKSAPAVKESC